MSGFIEYLAFLVGALIPRFIEEDVAVDVIDGEYVPRNPVSAIECGDVHDGISTYKGFTWLNINWVGKLQVPLRPFVNPKG